MSAFSRLLNSVDDSKAGDDSANSKFNITEQLEREIPANKISTYSSSPPLPVEVSKDLGNNEVPTLYSGSSWSPSIPIAPSDLLHDALPDHNDSPVAGLDSTMATLEAVGAQDVNSSTDYTRDQTSQTSPNVHPLIAPPSSDGKVSKKPTNYVPRPSASTTNTVSTVGRHVDASARVQSAQSTRITKETKPSLTKNLTSPPSSSFQASQNGSKQVSKSQSARIAATGQSVPSTFEGNMSGSPQRDGFPRNKPGTVAWPLASTTNLNSSHKGDWHTKAAMPTSRPDYNYSSQPKTKIDHQASSGSYQSSTSPLQTTDSSLQVKSTPLLGSSVGSNTTSPSSYPLAGSPSSAIGASYTGKLPKSQTSQVPSSDRKPEGKINPAPVIPGISADSNDNTSSLTSLDTAQPCQVAISSDKSKARSTPQVDCDDSSTGSYSVSSNFSSSISATSKKSSSSRTEISQNLSYPTSAEVHGNKQPTTLDKASKKDMNSSSLASGGVDKTHPSNGNLSPVKGPPPMLGGDVSVNSNSSTSIPTHYTSSSSSTYTQASENTGRTDTFSESRGYSRGRLVQTSQHKSTKHEQTSNEWRISVQNSSSDFAAQPPLKDPNGTHARPWHPMSASTQNATQPRLTSQHVKFESARSKNSSSYSESFNSTGTSSISGGREESSKPSEKGQSSSWFRQALLPGSPSPEQGYQVSTGGKITAISVGLGFSVGVLVLVLLGGLMKRRVLRKSRPAAMQISNPTSQAAEDVESIFSSHLDGSMQGDGHHPPNPRFDPAYRASTGRESGVDPFRTSYPINRAAFPNRYESYASSFGNLAREDLNPGHYPGPPSHPQGILRADKRRSDGTSVIPITFHHNQPEPGAVGFATEDYERQDALPHSGVPWNPDHQNNDDCGTEVATRFSDGETMIEDGPARHFSPDQAPPVPPLHWQYAR